MNSGLVGTVMSKMSTSCSSVLSIVTAYARGPSCQTKTLCADCGTTVGSWTTLPSSGERSPAPWISVFGLAGSLTS